MRTAIALSTALLTLAPLAAAQCQNAWVLPPPGQDVNALIHAMTGVNSPFSPVYAGGEFTEAGGQPAAHIAQWNGQTWSPLGTGTDDQVFAITIQSDGVIAGGDFMTAGGVLTGPIAQWSPAAGWQSMNLPPFTGSCTALARSGLDVLAVTHHSGQTTVLRGNGSSWTPLGANLSWVGYTMVVIGQDIHVGGAVPGVPEPTATGAQWNGQSWVSTGFPGNCCGSVVRALGRYQSAPVLGGLNVPAKRWNGTQWATLGTGGSSSAAALASFQGHLVEGVDAFFSGNPAANAWNGASWSPLGTGGPNGRVLALFPRGQTLFVGGLPYVNGFTPVAYWARYECPCYADCNKSGSLTIADYGCFQTQFALSNPYADCNSDGLLTIADFPCFQQAFGFGPPCP